MRPQGPPSCCSSRPCPPEAQLVIGVEDLAWPRGQRPPLPAGQFLLPSGGWETVVMGDNPASAAFISARQHANELGLSLLDAVEMIGADEEGGR